ncbi:MAG TPA: outer membrane beta-barrel protein, partial [Gemmatimonadaceae bacterium]|nr:outer membrane beta-barrel protein [Gemmatimonadaceae bacterium]
FLTAGGAILRFDPDSAPRTSQVALKFGGGLQFGSPGSVRLSVFAEDMMFRLNRYSLAARDPMGPLQSDSAADDVRHNLSVGAAVHIPLGGSAPFEEGVDIGLGAVGMPIELFAGRLDFDDDAGLARQDVLGARAGVNFGRLVSLRGYFWHGVSDDFDDTAPIRSWGGEAQFNLGTGSGIVPYLLAGAGKIDFRDDYRDIAGNPREDRTALILGGGAALALNEHLRLTFAARDYLFSEQDISDVASTDDLRHNWMLSAGFHFNVFARDPRPPVRTVRQLDTVRVSRIDTLRQRDTVFVDEVTGERIPAERGRMLARERDDRRDSLERDDRAPRREMVERSEVERRTGEAREDRGGTERGYRGDETIVIPVPMQGEIYIRYGPEDEGSPGEARFRRFGPPQQQPGMRPQGAPGAITDTREDLRAIIRDELDRARMSESAAALMRADTVRAGAIVQGLTSEEFLQRLEQRLTDRSAAQRDSVRAIVRQEIGATLPDDRMDDRIARIVDERMRDALDERDRRFQTQLDERDRRLQTQPEAPSVIVVQGDTARAVTVAAAEPPRPVFTELEPQSWAGYSGFTVNDGAQFLLGGRLDLGAISTGLTEIDFIPELAIGVGSGATSLHIAGNARYRFGGWQVNGLGLVRPYGQLGLGLLNFSNNVHGRDGLDLVINAGYGVTAESPGPRGFAYSGARELFIEHQGIGFFGLNRLLVGLVWGN